MHHFKCNRYINCIQKYVVPLTNKIWDYHVLNHKVSGLIYNYQYSYCTKKISQIIDCPLILKVYLFLKEDTAIFKEKISIRWFTLNNQRSRSYHVYTTGIKVASMRQKHVKFILMILLIAV